MQDIITINKQREYPKLLQKIGKDVPKQLYYKGCWNEEIFKNCLAVVGSRRNTSYGKRAVEQLVGEIARAGITIVSGFMYGIDALAHTAALYAGGKTIAVMPCGIERIHPAYQKKLYEEILQSGGLIVSEYEGNTAPGYWMYPQRNRIVAGLCKATLVIEAGEKSGSLITASYATKFGRKLFAVPGPIISEVSKGTNQLLKEQATLVTSARDIVTFFGLLSKQSAVHSMYRNHGKTEQFIVEYLKGEPMDIDTLSRALHISVATLGTILSMMELSGSIVLEGGKYHIKL